MLASVLELEGANNRITPLEGLRGYAVFLVFLVHHHTLFGQYLPAHGTAYGLSRLAHDIGYTGVDLFFVLSGFLIYGHLLRKPVPYFAFIRKRVRRIYPAFLAVFCVYVLLSHLVPSFSKLPHSAGGELVYLLENLLLLPGMLPIVPLITVAWSLSYEFFFYLSIPLVVGFAGLRGWSRSRRVLFFAGLLAVCFAGYGAGVFAHIRLGMFVFGILLCEAVDSGRLKPALTARGEIAAIAFYFSTIVGVAAFEIGNREVVAPSPSGNAGFALLGVALFALSSFCFAFDGRLRRVFSLTPLRWLGNMSYSYFLFHGLILKGAASFLEDVIPADTSSVIFHLSLLVLNFVLTFAGSLVLFVLVEKPFSLAGKRPAAAAPVAPVSLDRPRGALLEGSSVE